MKKHLHLGLALLVLQFALGSLEAGTYYMGPWGDDTSAGTPSQPWATFGRAWKSVRPGDTLILLDGVYYTTLQPPFGGSAGNPITIRAQNDGKAVIDGEYQRPPIYLANHLNAHYFVIEGIIARNGTIVPSPLQVIYIETDHNTLRRVSAYNGQTDQNTTVIGLAATAEYNLLEDCVAAGTGRKMINLYKGQYNTVRRCFAYWLGWDGKDSCQDWPNGGNIHVYNASNCTVENSIAAGPVGGFSILVQANSDSAVAVGNKVLGTVAINTAMNPDGTPIDWPGFRPLPTSCDPNKVIDFENWIGHRSGFRLHGQGAAQLSDTLLRDIVAIGNAGNGFSAQRSSNYSGNRIERGTIIGNGLDASAANGGKGCDVLYSSLAGLTITDSNIGVVRDSQGKTYPSYQGTGARLRFRYIDGVLMDGNNGQPAQPLWPWPMEQRVREELGVSVTNLMAQTLPGEVTPIPAITKANLHLSPMFATFPVTVGSNPTTQLITLTNPSDASGLSVRGFAFEKAAASPFSITTQGTCPSPPFVLGPSQSCTVQVAFRAAMDGAHGDYLLVDSPDVPPYPFGTRVYLAGLYREMPTSSSLPAVLEAEHYANAGGTFKLKATADNGSLKIGGVQSGAWLEYPVLIAQSGSYTITARVASNSTATQSFSLLLNGTVIANFSPGGTGGWEKFTNSVVSGVNLQAGKYTLRANFSSGSFDLNYLHFSLGGSSALPPSAPKNLSIVDIK